MSSNVKITCPFCHAAVRTVGINRHKAVCKTKSKEERRYYRIHRVWPLAKHNPK